jgi:hypothetical protein
MLYLILSITIVFLLFLLTQSWNERRAILRYFILEYIGRTGETYAIPLARYLDISVPESYSHLKWLEWNGKLITRVTAETYPERGGRTKTFRNIPSRLI